jgi:hypothetical protein
MWLVSDMRWKILNHRFEVMIHQFAFLKLEILKYISPCTYLLLLALTLLITTLLKEKVPDMICDVWLSHLAIFRSMQQL